MSHVSSWRLNGVGRGMFSTDDLVLEKLDLLLTEAALLQASGPHFRIVHRFRKAGILCGSGEEIACVHLMHRSREHVVPLSLTLRVLFDYLAKHPRWPQNASQIAAGIAADPFYRKHGANAGSQAKLTRSVSRSGVKELIKRIRRALDLVCREASLCLNPEDVLCAEKTVMNEVGYRLKANCQWIHVDLA
ncbi:MAG: hypothetical protein JO340_06985 [Acidobacteriaceae bacterium]|nr:hypothetical protein [Acidobacteriaceae bacterium]